MSISVECDGCGESTNVDEVEWDNSMAFCLTCAATMLEIPEEIRVAKDLCPLYFMYDETGRLLHITSDFDSPILWRTYQGERWWWNSVASIVIKFFETSDQVSFAKGRLINNLSPRYGVAPDPEEDLDGEEQGAIHYVNPASSRKTLDKSLQVRVTTECYLQITEAAASDGVKRGDWVRSVLQNALSI